MQIPRILENDGPENLGTKSDIFLSGFVSDFGKAKFSSNRTLGKYDLSPNRTLGKYDSSYKLVGSLVL